MDMSDMEQVAYRLSGTTLQRYSTVTGAINWQAVAENINQLEYRYLDENGNNLDVNGNFAATSSHIYSIQVSIMVQTSKAAVNGPPAQTYTTPSGATWTSTPGFRSRYFSTTVQCRNLGL
jgi:type IV pilus assembly protein PilW